jgi:hypothetical protein
MIDTVIDGILASVNRQQLRLVVIEGGAPGADTFARDWARTALWSTAAWAKRVDHLPFDADWTLLGKAAGPIRNKRMLNEGQPELVVAFKDGFDITKSGAGRGTEHMVRIAKAAGVECWVMAHT